jgi:hypothetical protein
MVLLHLRTDNPTNTTLAKFDSIYEDSFIQFSNINNNLYYSGITNNSFKIYNPTNANDEGLLYNNNQLSVKTQNTQIIKYNTFTIFPNDFTLLNTYQFTEYNQLNPIGFSNCFDMNVNTFWQSDAIYSRNDAGSINLTNINVSDPYNFHNSNSRGYWIKIKFPYQVIPIGVYFSSLTTLYSPIFFDVFVSNDNINWTKVLVVNTTTVGNEFFFRENTTLYLYVAIVITKIIVDTGINAPVLQSFKVNEIRIYTMPILHLDNNVKIMNNNMLNLNTISTNRLILNNSLITSANDLNTTITNQAVQTIVNLYNFYWTNNGTTGFLNSNIVNRIAINSNITNSTLGINGDINYRQKSINNFFTLTNRGGIFDITSSYVYIGRVRFVNNSLNYFKLSLVLFEYDKYYFQTININGYSSFSSNLNIYWDTIFDNTYTPQRITDVNYIVESNVNNRTSILFYCRYNPILNITSAVANNDFISEYINNITYIDFTNTSFMSNVEFIIRTPATNTINFDNDIYSNANLISSRSLNKNNNIINLVNTRNLRTSNIQFSTSIASSNFLILDSNKNIIDSGISSNSLSILSQFGNNTTNSNRILGTNSNGILSYLNVSSLLLSNINFHATTCNNTILISSNNLFEGFIINRNNLSNLNVITNFPNSLVVVNNSSQLSTVTNIPLSNIDNNLRLFNFNNININNNNYIFCNSNISLNNINVRSNINIGNSHIITSNLKFTKPLINNREFAEDIFKLITKFPNIPSLQITNKYETPFNPILPLTVPIDFSVTFNNGSVVSLGIHTSDNNSDVNRKIYNIFDKSLTSYWISNANFLDYTNTSYGATIKLTDDPLSLTNCGSYIIFDFAFDFILNFYIIYVNYPNLINSIRDFKLFGYNKSLQIWELIDQRFNIILNNNLIPNTFNLNKSNNNIYSKYAICIINTHNKSSVNTASVIVNGIEFYGYPINSNLYSLSNLMTFNSENSSIFMGTSNIGILNYDPYSPLSIGNDLPSNPRNSMMNINHTIPIDNSNIILNQIEVPIVTLTRHSLNSDIRGIKSTHYLNSWYNSNTNYTIKLSHSNINNEKTILSMNSSGNIAIGGYPHSNLSNNGLSFYDNNSKFINVYASSITSNYSLILPGNQAIKDMSLFVDNVDINNQVFLKFDKTENLLFKLPIVNFSNISFSNNNSNINIQTPIINSNYSIFLPPTYGTSNMTFVIDKIVNNSNLYMKFANPVSNLISTSFIKIGDETIPTRNQCNLTVQIAGKCLIGSNSNEIYNLNSNYLSNTLVVVGKIYTTKDISSDSDISYKYNIKLIEDPIGKINKINGYTFNRNDTDDNNRYSGLIAQEVIKVMPEVVIPKHDGKYRIIYTNLAGLFVEGIKKINDKTDYINFKVNCLIGGIIGFTSLYLYSKKR